MAILKRLVALFSGLGQKPKLRAAKVAPPPEKVQDEFYIDLLGRIFKEGDEVCFWGSRDDWNAIVQTTASRFPNQPNLGQLFRWHKGICPHPTAPLGFLQARGRNWKELWQQAEKTGEEEVFVVIFLHKLNRKLHVGLDLTPDLT